jgi:hypothetical protein
MGSFFMLLVCTLLGSPTAQADCVPTFRYDRATSYCDGTGRSRVFSYWFIRFGFNPEFRKETNGRGYCGAINCYPVFYPPVAYALSPTTNTGHWEQSVQTVLADPDPPPYGPLKCHDSGPVAIFYENRRCDTGTGGTCYSKQEYCLMYPDDGRCDEPQPDSRICMPSPIIVAIAGENNVSTQL